MRRRGCELGEKRWELRPERPVLPAPSGSGPGRCLCFRDPEGGWTRSWIRSGHTRGPRWRFFSDTWNERLVTGLGAAWSGGRLRQGRLERGDPSGPFPPKPLQDSTMFLLPPCYAAFPLPPALRLLLSLS